MSAFIPKHDQQSVLESVERYFRETQRVGNADKAFYNATLDLWGNGSAYHPIDGFDAAMPYFCLRIPTGGGKTWLAAKSVGLVNQHLPRSEFSVILWLVPSTTIREQTLRALRDREHPYHAALREAGPVTVLTLDEAKSATRAALESSTTVIVSTVQAFRREDTGGLKVYESNGALMSHFEHLDHAQIAELQRDENGTVVCSLASVLRLRRPFLIVDEAHNSRTTLSFSTFANFRPSGIMELTATPDTEKTPSNVPHSVSAAKLKTEHMIKLPIRLETEGDWQKCLAYAIDCSDQLQSAAEAERRQGAPYLRPLVLIQAEPRRKDVETRNVEAVRRELVENQNVPEHEIVIATGEARGLEVIDKQYARGIADARCPVKYVITQQALAEGWDCPSAYVLASMAELRSSTAVEQCCAGVEVFHTPAELGERLSVPQMALRAQDELQLFDDPEVLDYPWELSTYDADPTKSQIDALNGNRVAEGGEIDIDAESGKVTTRFIADLQRDLGLSYRPEHWNEIRLATWLAKNLPETAITHVSKRAFVARAQSVHSARRSPTQQPVKNPASASTAPHAAPSASPPAMAGSTVHGAMSRQNARMG